MRRRLRSKAAEVVVGVEEGDMETGVEEGGGKVEHAVDVALQRPRKHKHVGRSIDCPSHRENGNLTGPSTN